MTKARLIFHTPADLQEFCEEIKNPFLQKSAGTETVLGYFSEAEIELAIGGFNAVVEKGTDK